MNVFVVTSIKGVEVARSSVVAVEPTLFEGCTLAMVVLVAVSVEPVGAR